MNQGMIEGAKSGVSTGASLGGGIGAMFGPIGSGIGAGLGGLAGGAIGGYLGRKRRLSPMEQKQENMIDELLRSLQGNGQYSDLFNMNEADFNKYYANPMKNRFNNQIMPMIQQGYLATGMQRGTGLDNALARAGMELNDSINQMYGQQRDSINANRRNAMNTILGRPAGQQASMSGWQGALEGMKGYLSTPRFGQDMATLGRGIGNYFNQRNQKQAGRGALESAITAVNSRG